MGEFKEFGEKLSLSQVSKSTAAEKLKNASTVDNKIMRAMRPSSAPKRSASRATLLALGKAATGSGYTTNFIGATGT